jgi:tetratricopeptide (TPR) repeat protein
MLRPCLAGLALLLAAAPLFAQNNDADREGQRPADQSAAESQASQAAAQSANLNAPGADVTFEQVSADPDNADLNFRYAQTQVRAGNLKGASATLERILLLNPDLTQVRLFYGVVLFRLDNLVEADREVSAVLAQNPADDVRKEAEKYLVQIRQRQKRTQISGRLGVGWEYDDNRNAAPSSGLSEFLGLPVQLNPGSLRTADTSAIFMGNVEAHHDLGTAAGHEVFTTFNYYRAEQTQQKNLNLIAYSPALGGVYKTAWFDVIPQGVYDYVELAQTKFLTDRGADVRIAKTLSARADLYADVRDVRQVYSPTAVVPTATDRTGIQVDMTVGGDYSFAATNRFGYSGLYTVKHAQNNAFTFFRKGVGFSDTWLLGRGMFVLASEHINVDRYQQPDPATGAGQRLDTTFQTDLTFGAPLSLLDRRLDDFVATFSFENYDAQSTVTNYSYTNNKISALLTYKWAAGF